MYVFVVENGLVCLKSDENVTCYVVD